MKKTFPVNINGSVFYIDEDAYQLLNRYLDQLRKAFPGAEGKEITADIEGRIAEHFTERIDAGARVIVLEDVNTVIETMGRPADIAEVSEDADSPEPPSDTKPRPAGDHGGSVPPPFPGSVPAQAQSTPVKRLYRDERNKVFGGVFAGLGLYLGWNVTMMRVLYVILALCTQLWPCVLIYLIAWMVIPAAVTPRQILEMTGSPVTVGSVGQTILGTADPNGTAATGRTTATNVFAILGKVVMAFLGLIAGCVGLGFLVVFIVGLCAIIAFTGWGSVALLDNFDILGSVHPMLEAWAVLTVSLAVLLPCAAVIWGACCALFNARGASRTLIITSIVLEVIFIAASVILINLAEFDPDSLGATVGAASALTATVPFQIA